MSFTSSFGQTFFISLFGPSIQLEFYSISYFMGNYLSYRNIVKCHYFNLFRQFNRLLQIKFYTYFSVIALVFSCFFISMVSSYFFNICYIFTKANRSGSTSHISVTTMARYFSEKRGTAIAIGSLGMALVRQYYLL